MAVGGTITDAGGGALVFTGAAGLNSTLKIDQNTTNTRFTLTTDTITNSFGSGTGGGTTTVNIPTANIVSVTVDLGDGTNVLNLQYANVATAFNPSAGTNTLNICSNAPTNTGTTAAIAANVSVAPTGGTLNVTIADDGNASGQTVAVTSTTVTGLLGSGGANTLTYSGVGTLRLQGSNNASAAVAFTVNAPSCTALRMEPKGGSASGNTVELLADCLATVQIAGASSGRFYTVTSNGHTAAGWTNISNSFSTKLADDFYVTGTATAGGAGSTFDTQGHAVTLDSLISIGAAVWICGAGKQTFNGGLTVSSTGTFTGSTGDVDVNGNLTLSGTATFTAPSGAFTVSGNIAVSGTPTFTAGTNTVTLDGAGGSTQVISGSTTFYNLVATAAAARAITFTDGTTQTVTNSLTLTGSSGQLLTLQGSGSAGWTLAVPSTQSISYVSVSRSTATGNTALAGSTSTDGGNNVNWTFGTTRRVAPARIRMGLGLGM